MSAAFEAIHYAVMEELKPFTDYEVTVAVRFGLVVKHAKNLSDFVVDLTDDWPPSVKYSRASDMFIRTPVLSISLLGDVLAVADANDGARFKLCDPGGFDRFLAHVVKAVTEHTKTAIEPDELSDD